MNMIEYIREAEREAWKQHINANSVMLNSKIKLVREGYTNIDSDIQLHHRPIVCGLSAFLTDELPDDIAFAVFESQNVKTHDEKIKQEARQELLDKIRAMSLDEIADLLKEREENETT